jgi:glycine betaine transporter
MSTSFKRIVVTTDFSGVADRAIDPAFRLAADAGAKIFLCHVIDTPAAANPLYAHYYPTDLIRPESRQKAEVKARNALLARVPKRGSLARVPHEAVIAYGNPVEEIVRVSRKLKADLVAISTHGYTGLKSALLGSVAERVIRHAHCPVLVVR